MLMMVGVMLYTLDYDMGLSMPSMIGGSVKVIGQFQALMVSVDTENIVFLRMSM